MVFSKKNKLILTLIVISISNILFFQNCSKTQFNKVEQPSEFGSVAPAGVDDGSGPQCSFADQILNDQEIVTAYQASTVPFGSSCISESRVCRKGTLSGSYEAKSCQVLPPETADLCSHVSQVIGDMRTDIKTAIGSEDYSILEFGTFADNYWVGNPETFDRKLEFFVENPELVSEFNLVQAVYDDWIAIAVNGRSVYYGPYTGTMTKLVVDLNTKLVQYADGLSSRAELSTNWNKTLDINIKPYLISGKNTITVRTVVAGAGESFMKFKYKTACQ